MSGVVAYADGACRGNPGPAGAGALVLLPDGRQGEASLALGHATNNIGELSAIGLVLDLLTEPGVDTTTEWTLYTDSKYTMGVLTKNWKAKANQELIAGLKGRLREWTGVTMEWVPGHAGVWGNERADALARAGVEGETQTYWSGPA